MDTWLQETSNKVSKIGVSKAIEDISSKLLISENFKLDCETPIDDIFKKIYFKESEFTDGVPLLEELIDAVIFYNNDKVMEIAHIDYEFGKNDPACFSDRTTGAYYQDGVNEIIENIFSEYWRMFDCYNPQSHIFDMCKKLKFGIEIESHRFYYDKSDVRYFVCDCQNILFNSVYLDHFKFDNLMMSENIDVKAVFR